MFSCVSSGLKALPLLHFMSVKDPFPANLLFDAELQSIFALLPAGVGILVLADNFWQACVVLGLNQQAQQGLKVKATIAPFQRSSH